MRTGDIVFKVLQDDPYGTKRESGLLIGMAAVPLLTLMADHGSGRRQNLWFQVRAYLKSISFINTVPSTSSWCINVLKTDTDHSTVHLNAASGF